MDNLEVKKTTITQEATMKTENASYAITFSVSDGKLQTLTAIVRDTQQTEGPGPNGTVSQYEQPREIGRITVDGYGHISMPSMLYTEKLPLYMSDFVKIIQAVSGTAQETGTE